MACDILDRKLTHQQDLKDFARQSGLDVVYSEVNRERDPAGGGKGQAIDSHIPTPSVLC